MIIFNTISNSHSLKDIKNICNKLDKSCSFDSGKDAELLCKLAYLLYVSDDFENVKSISKFTHEAQFPGKGYFRVWDFILSIWGLEAYILLREGNTDLAQKRINEIRSVYEFPLPDIYESSEHQKKVEDSRRNSCNFIDVLRQKEIANAASVRSANSWRLIALYKMIGYTFTGLYPDLVVHQSELERAIDVYVQKLKLQYCKG